MRRKRVVVAERGSGKFSETLFMQNFEVCAQFRGTVAMADSIILTFDGLPCRVTNRIIISG